MEGQKKKEESSKEVQFVFPFQAVVTGDTDYFHVFNSSAASFKLKYDPERLHAAVKDTPAKTDLSANTKSV